MNKGNLLTPREAAQRLGLTLSFVYMELWANRIPGARQSGRHWQIPESAIEERLKKNGARPRQTTYPQGVSVSGGQAKRIA